MVCAGGPVSYCLPTVSAQGGNMPHHPQFILFSRTYREGRYAEALALIDGLIAQGVGYIYFIDEIFLPNRELLDAALVLIGGTLLLTPGFVTDILGFFLVLPFTRPLGFDDDGREVLTFIEGDSGRAAASVPDRRAGA